MTWRWVAGPLLHHTPYSQEHDYSSASPAVTLAPTPCVGPSFGPNFGSKGATQYLRAVVLKFFNQFQAIQDISGVTVPTVDPSKPADARALLSLQVQRQLFAVLFFGVPWMCSVAQLSEPSPSKRSAAILMYCFARSGICNKTYSAAGSSSVEIQCRNLRWHFTSRDPVAGLAAADLRYLPSPRRLLVT